MASAYTPKWKRLIIKYIPFIHKKCPEGNYHWRWARLCYCRCNEYWGDEWHGGILDFKTGKELIPYEKP